jgi:hypothetical protein
MPPLDDPASYGFGHPTQLSVGVALNCVLLLDFDSDVLWPALLAFHKAIVKSGHWLATMLPELSKKKQAGRVPGGAQSLPLNTTVRAEPTSILPLATYAVQQHLSMLGF